MESFATPYPLTFHDGEAEHEKGHVGVHSVLTFKRLQAILSQKTGHPATHLSLVLVCSRKDKQQQKLPINENTNFSIILNQHNPSKEKGCHFLVSLKKSKKERMKGIPKKRITESEGDSSSSDFGGANNEEEELEEEEERLVVDKRLKESSSSSNSSSSSSSQVSVDKKTSPDNERVLLRRDLLNTAACLRSKVDKRQEEGKTPIENDVQRQNTVRPPPILLKRPLYPVSSGVLSLQEAKAIYLNSQKQHSWAQMQVSNEALLQMSGVVRGLAGIPNSAGVCRYCYSCKERNINPAPFHPCVHDRVVTGLRGPSPAGPIERPPKRLEAAA